MAGALFYQDIMIPVNLSSLEQQPNSLDRVNQFYEDQICSTYNNVTVYKPIEKVHNYAYINGVFNSINMAGQFNITNTHCQNLKSLQSQIKNLLELFSNVDATPEDYAHPLNHHKWFGDALLQEGAQLLKISVNCLSVHAHSQHCRFIFGLASLTSRICGIYNGIYTRQQLHHLYKGNAGPTLLHLQLSEHSQYTA